MFYMQLKSAGEGGDTYNAIALGPIKGLIEQLKDYLEQFENLSGDSVVTSYYKRRYAQIVWDMHEKLYIDVDTAIFYKTEL